MMGVVHLEGIILLTICSLFNNSVFEIVILVVIVPFVLAGYQTKCLEEFIGKYKWWCINTKKPNLILSYKIRLDYSLANIEHILHNANYLESFYKNHF